MNEWELKKQYIVFNSLITFILRDRMCNNLLQCITGFEKCKFFTLCDSIYFINQQHYLLIHFP